MTRAALALVAGLTLLPAAPASAAMLEISTSVSATDADDPAVLRRAIETAVDELVKEGLPFTPTVMLITRAHTTAGRAYVRILLSDEPATQPFRDVSTPASEVDVTIPAPSNL